MASDTEALLQAAEEETAREVDRLLAEMSQEILRELDNADEIVAARFRLSSIAAMWRQKVPRLMRRLFRVAQQAADTAETDTGGTLPDSWGDLPTRFDDDTLPAALDSYAEATRVLLDAVGTHMAEAAVKSLNEGIAAGESTEELKARLAVLFSADGTELGPARTALIAATESTRAWNASTLAAAQDMQGLDRPLVKQWRTQGDAKVREQHKEVNGQLQRLDDAFNVAGVSMQYPGDPAAPADLVVNCRCYLQLSPASSELSAAMTDEPDDFQSSMPAPLKRYWLEGEGAGKIGWGTPGSFDRCVKELRDDFPEDTEGLCANLYHEATGEWPGRKKEHSLEAAGGEVHKGAMIALIPTAEDAERYAIEGGEAPEELHVTLFFVAEDAADWDAEQRAELVAQMTQMAGYLDGPIQARTFGMNCWNPGSDSPAWVWPVGDAEGFSLEAAHWAAVDALESMKGERPELPVNYTPWVAHMTAAYTSADWPLGRDESFPMALMAERVGPVTFDRIRVVFGGEATDIPLTQGVTAAAAPVPYEVGDRVTITTAPHEEGHLSGTIAEINQGPAYGIVFDGTEEVHHWYVGDELAPESEGPMPDEEMTAADPALFPMRTWSTPGDTALAFENEQTGDGRVFAPEALYWDDGPWPLQYCDSMGEGHDGAELAGSIQELSRDGARIPGSGNLYMTQDAGWEAALLLDQDAPLGVSVDLDDVDLEVRAKTTGYDAGEPSDEAVASATTRIDRMSVMALPDGGWSLVASDVETVASGTDLVRSMGGVHIVTGPGGTLTAAAALALVPELESVSAAAGDPDSAEGELLETQTAGDFVARITRARVRGATLVAMPAYSRARIVIDPLKPMGEDLAEPVPVQEQGEVDLAASDSLAQVIQYVANALTPVSVKQIAEALGMSPSTIRRHLRTAIEEGKLVKLGRNHYSAATTDLTVQDDALAASASGKTDLPVASKDTTWDGDAAAESVFGWAEDADGNIDASKARDAFFWYDESAPELRGSYKLGFARLQDGSLQMVPAGVFAAAAAVQGARGGVDIPADDMDAVKSKISAAYSHISEELGEEHTPPWDEEAASAFDELEASVWTAMRDADPMPAAWFQEPTPEELPPGSGGVHYKDGRVFGWVAQTGVPHASHGPKVTIEKLAKEGLDTSHFLRARFKLDDGSEVRAGAFTMNVGHHRDGYECETAACQFDDSRTVGGIVTVGLNEGGLWFSGAASPWMSSWDLNVFKATQPSYHLVRGRDNRWQLRGILSVPVPGHSSPLTAAAVIDRTNLALTASAMAVLDREAGCDPNVPGGVTEEADNALTSVSAVTASVTEAVTAALSSPSFLDSLAAAMDRRAAEKASVPDTLAALKARVGGSLKTKDTAVVEEGA